MMAQSEMRIRSLETRIASDEQKLPPLRASKKRALETVEGLEREKEELSLRAAALLDAHQRARERADLEFSLGVQNMLGRFAATGQSSAARAPSSSSSSSSSSGAADGRTV